MRQVILGSLLCATVGCFSFPKRDIPQASVSAAARVDTVGAKLIAANPQYGTRPTFLTIGVNDPVLFHRGAEQLYVSEGMVNACKTDAELTAVLCHELGKMAGERPARRPYEQPDREPPTAPKLTPDVGGGGYGPDGTHAAELAMWEKDHPRRRATNFSPQDATCTAKTLIEKAGYSVEELAKIDPLLRKAEAPNEYERQLTTPWLKW